MHLILLKLIFLPCSFLLLCHTVSASGSTSFPEQEKQVLASQLWYVAPDGNDTGAGTINAPFKTISKAAVVAAAGDTIFVRGGTHYYNFTINLNKGGTSENKIYLFAYPGEKPVLDFSALAVNSSNRGMNVNANYWHIKGLDIYKAGDNGMYVRGSYNIIEFCSFYENNDTGLQLGQGAAYNRIVNCDSYFNADPSHGNADGFAPKLDVGTGNYFYGCRAWQNSDDGWDGYMRGNNDVTTTLENCWVFKSGYLKNGSTSSGNGNGFKMGGSDDRTLSHNMILLNCLAFDNRDKGFDQNNNKGSMTIYNGTAYNNGRNYSISQSVASGKIVTVANCISAGTGAVQLGSFVVQLTNSWMSGFTTTAADFVSTVPAEAYGPRKPDGSLPEISFMHLQAGSDLIDRGTFVGLPFKGAAPDLGCFEFDNAALSVPGAVEEGAALQLTATPNPVSGTVSLQFSTTTKSVVTLQLLNVTGQEIARLYDGALAAGTKQLLLYQTDALQAGVYLVVLQNDTHKIVKRLLVTR